MSAAPQVIATERIALVDEALTQEIIGAAIEIHRHLGPGLLESAYEECLCHELKLRGLNFRRQVSLPVVYKGVALDCGYKMDLVAEDRVVIELKCVEAVLGVHQATAYLSEIERQTCRIALQLSCFSHDARHCPQGPMTLLLLFSVPRCLRGKKTD